MKFRLLEVAELELDEAVVWYRSKGLGIAQRFLAEVTVARSRITHYPNAWHPLGEGVRRYRLSRFPYGLVYTVGPDEILVIAIAHHSRRPGYWRDRLEAR